MLDLHAIDATPARWRGGAFLTARPSQDGRDALIDFHTGAICISISAVLSLAISVIHFRMPCWEAETKDPEWFY